MKKTVMFTFWMFLLIIGLLSRILFRYGSPKVALKGRPAEIDSAALLDQEAIPESTPIKSVLNQDRLVEYKNIYWIRPESFVLDVEKGCGH